MKLSQGLRILLKAKHGAAMVELALLLPVLLLLVVGAADFGRAYFVYLRW